MVCCMASWLLKACSIGSLVTVSFLSVIVAISFHFDLCCSFHRLRKKEKRQTPGNTRRLQKPEKRSTLCSVDILVYYVPLRLVPSSSDSSQVNALLRAHELQKAEEEVEAALDGLGFWVMSFSSIAD